MAAPDRLRPLRHRAPPHRLLVPALCHNRSPAARRSPASAPPGPPCSFFRNAAAGVIVYDITNPSSFANTRQWLRDFMVRCRWYGRHA